MIVLAYLWVLALVPLVVARQDPEVQWHAKHGLVLMIAELLLLFGYIVMTSMQPSPSVARLTMLVNMM